MRTSEEIDEMLYRDYRLRMRAHNYNLIDKERDLYWLAYLGRVVSATEETRGGKVEYVYKSFEDFYDYDSVRNSILGEEEESAEEREQRAKLDAEELRLRRLMLMANRER